jgi:hypothetical protein
MVKIKCVRRGYPGLCVDRLRLEHLEEDVNVGGFDRAELARGEGALADTMSLAHVVEAGRIAYLFEQDPSMTLIENEVTDRVDLALGRQDLFAIALCHEATNAHDLLPYVKLVHRLNPHFGPYLPSLCGLSGLIDSNSTCIGGS